MPLRGARERRSCPHRAAICFMTKNSKYKNKGGYYGGSSGETAKDRLEKAREDIYNKVLQGLKEGKNVWEMPWLAASGRQKNYVSGKPYRGINAFILGVLTAMKGYNDNRWITFNQMVERKHKFVGDAKGAGVKIYHYNWKYFEEEDEETGEKTLERKLCGVSEFVVFNVSLTDIPPEPSVVGPGFTPEEICEKMLSVSPAPIYYGGSQAFYVPSTDEIHLPERETFKTALGFYGTAFHEMTHSTGHKKRLNRDLSGRFGSPSYAAEELVAEVGSVFLCAELGVTVPQKEERNHISYLLDWMEHSSVKDFNVALKKAENASDYLYGLFSDAYGEVDYGIRVNVFKYGTKGAVTGLNLLPVHEVAV